MANPKSNLNLIFPATMSLVFMLVALATLLKTQEPILTQLGYGTLPLIISPKGTLTMLLIKIYYPKWLKNLKVGFWVKISVHVLFELFQTMGSRLTIERSKVDGWDMIFAAFAFSLVFVASSFVTGSRFNFAAITTGAWMHQSGIGFWKECGSGIRAVVSSVMYFVVFAGVHYANPPGRYGVHYVEEVMEDGGNQGVKVAETQVKVAETQVKASETQVKLGESGVKSSETQVKVDESL